MLRLCFIRSARNSGVDPLPKSRSNTTCGFSSIGSGLVRGTFSSGGVGSSIQEIELVYEQLYPSPQLLELELGSSTASCSDGSSVSCPILRAMIWSIVALPTVASEPAVLRGLMPVRYAAATQWSEPVVPSGGSADCDHIPLNTTL